MARVIIGMSGGVDSSLAAVLLAEAGHEPIGVSMQLWPCDDLEAGDGCCSPGHARAVAADQGFPFYVVDFQQAFRDQVTDGFVAGYARGETPNPCISCNEMVKFGDLDRWGAGLGTEGVATGHYARIVERDGLRHIATATDTSKDQSYFLFSLSQEQLARAYFPLGEWTKDDVRAEATRRGLAPADRPDSQDLCFTGVDNLREFLAGNLGGLGTPGPIEHIDGRVLGEHSGLVGYTIGQRKGLRVAAGSRVYVCDIDTANNRLVLGPREALLTNEAWMRDCTWHGDMPPEGVTVRLRHRHQARLVDVTLLPCDLPGGGRGLRVVYPEPTPKPSPGQAGVAYDASGTIVLGGGWFIDLSAPQAVNAESRHILSDLHPRRWDRFKAFNQIHGELTASALGPRDADVGDGATQRLVLDFGAAALPDLGCHLINDDRPRLQLRHPK